MLIFEELKRDHDKIRAVLTEIEAATAPNVFRRSCEKRTVLLDTLGALLYSHIKAEEIAFYRMMAGFHSTSESALEAIEEHRIAEIVIEDLEDLSPLDPDWIRVFKLLKENLVHHMASEEKEFFASAKRIIGKDEAEEMADLFHEIRFAKSASASRIATSSVTTQGGLR